MLKKGFILLFCLLHYTFGGYASNSYCTEENDSIYTYEYVEYNGKTICFRKYKNSVMRAYVIELCNDSIKPDGKLGAIEYNYAVDDFLNDSTVEEAINKIRAIAKNSLNETGFTIKINISGPGEIVGVIFRYKTIMAEFIGAKEIFYMTNEIMKNIKFIPPEKFGCNIIKIYIPIQR
jgi:hypothetical protein